MATHRIFLKGPWDYAWQHGRSGGLEPVSLSGTVAMPRGWRAIFGETTGVARFRRKFHRPTNLEPHERVMVVFTEIRGQGSVQLNEHLLGKFNSTGNAVEFEISSLMNPFNEILIDIEFDPHQAPTQEGGLYGPVALEIRTEEVALSTS